MNNFEEIVGIKTRFENSTESELFSYLYSFQNKWVLAGNKNITSFIDKAIDNFGLSENFTYNDLNTNYLRCLYNVFYLQQEIVKNTPDERYEELTLIFNKIFESIDYASKMLKMGNILINSHSDESIEIKDDLGQLRFMEPNIETNSPFQNLILYLLDSIYLCGLQRYLDSLYEKIYYNGYFTHAWKEKLSIRKFIYEKTEFCQDYRQWHNLTSNSSNIKNATEYLENCKDPRINDLKKDRHVFAFRNGIYCCKEKENELYLDHFYEYGADLTKSLNIDIVACKFFNCNFNKVISIY